MREEKNKLNLKIVEASAGSGKTTKLASEYLSKLFLSFRNLILKRNPGDDFTSENVEEFRKTLNSVIAVTFTNPAANEMGERILGYLWKFSDIDNNYDGAIMTVFDEVSERCGFKAGESRKIVATWSKFFLELITTCYSDFNTGTIDSLSAKILKVVSPEIQGIKADFKLKDNIKEDLEDLVRDFLITKVENNWREVETSIEEIVQLDTRGNFNLDIALIKKIAGIFSLKNESSKIIEIKKLENKLWKTFYGSVSLCEKYLEVIEKHYDKINHNRFSESAEQSLRSIIHDDRKTFEQLFKIVEKSFVSKSYDYIIKVKTGDDVQKEIKDVFDPFSKSLKEFVYTYSSLKVAAISNLTAEFTVHFSERNKNTVYLQEIFSLIKHCLTEESLPYLYLKLSERFSHYLIDEFQDTSTAQIKMLAPLASNAVVSEKENSSLFIVGDRKQAIYQWRGIESGMLDQEKVLDLFKLTESAGTAGPYRENLDYNFRSDREIVGFNNSFWKKENLDMLGVFGLENEFDGNYSNTEQKLPAFKNFDAGYVEISVVEKNDDLENPAYSRIHETIVKIKESGWKNCDIAVLLRKNDHIKELFEYLSEKGHECITDEAMYLTNDALIREIISFIRFLDFPPDDLSFFEFAGSRLLGKAAESLGIKYRHRDDLYYKAQRRFYSVFRDEYGEVWNRLVDPFFKSVGFMTAYDVFQDMIYRFRIYENFPESSFFIIKLGETLHDLEVSQRTSISSFLSFIEDILSEKNRTFYIDIPQAEDKIKLLTLHKSKGLEFSNVILDISEELKGNTDGIYTDENGIKYIKKDWAGLDERLGNVYRKSIVKDNLGEFNLLYVAMTRAKHGLFMIGKRKKSGENKTGINRIIYFQDIVLENRHIKEKIDGNDLLSFGTLKEKKIKTEIDSEFLGIPSKKTPVFSMNKEYLVYKTGEIKSDRQKRGETIHETLSFLGVYKSGEKFEKDLKERLGLKLLDENERKEMISYLLKPEISKYFTGDIELFTEREILSDSGEIYRLDRIVIGKDALAVIDFKTGSENEKEHSEQLKKYKKKLEEIYTGRKIECVLIYLDEKKGVFVKN